MESFLTDVPVSLIHHMEFCKYFGVLNDLMVKKGLETLCKGFKGLEMCGGRVTLKLSIYQ